jgi:hypothetical protein
VNSIIIETDSLAGKYFEENKECQARRDKIKSFGSSLNTSPV